MGAQPDKRMRQKLYVGLILIPGEKTIRFWRYLDPTDKLEDIRQEEIQRWRNWEKRDDIDVRYYLIGEVDDFSIHLEYERYLREREESEPIQSTNPEELIKKLLKQPKKKEKQPKQFEQLELFPEIV